MSTLRPTILPLLARLRRELGVCADSYDDPALQEALDAHRASVFYRELHPALADDGTVLYTVHWTEGNDWEALSLYDEAKALIDSEQISLDESHLGMWHFTGQYRTVFITGYRHDLFAAAADLWDRRASDLAHQIDTASGDLRLSLSQAHKQAQERAAHYRSKARPRNVRMTRSDVAGGRGRWR